MRSNPQHLDSRTEAHGLVAGLAFFVFGVLTLIAVIAIFAQFLWR